MRGEGRREREGEGDEKRVRGREMGKDGGRRRGCSLRGSVFGIAEMDGPPNTKLCGALWQGTSPCMATAGVPLKGDCVPCIPNNFQSKF